jgi:hypothetical protein
LLVILAPGTSRFPWEFAGARFTRGLLTHIDAVSVHVTEAPAKPGEMEWTGWRLVTIPLNGRGWHAHWARANDGVPHAPLAWGGLVLIDSANRETPHGDEVLITAPHYVVASDGGETGSRKSGSGSSAN